MAIFNALNFLHEYEKAAIIADDIIKLSPDEDTASALSGHLSEEIIREKDVEKRLKMIENFLRTFPSGKESYMLNYLRLGIVQKDLKDREMLLRLGEEWLGKEPAKDKGCLLL